MNASSLANSSGAMLVSISSRARPSGPAAPLKHSTYSVTSPLASLRMRTVGRVVMYPWRMRIRRCSSNPWGHPLVSHLRSISIGFAPFAFLHSSTQGRSML